MFNSIKGTVSAKFPRQVFIECSGVEWDVCVPDSNIELLPPVGSVARIFTWLHHTDSIMALYGFSSPEERDVFLNLLKVDGVGPKGAVKIMSSVASSNLLQILENGDIGLLEKIPGVGKKTAGKMMLALKGKIEFQHTENQPRGNGKSSQFEAVVLSLVEMGYDRSTVEKKIYEILEKLSADSEFSAKSEKDREDFIFRQVIVELA